MLGGSRYIDPKTVLLQAMKEDPPLDAKCRDKFLVQSVIIPADKDSGNATNIVRQSKSSLRIWKDCADLN